MASEPYLGCVFLFAGNFAPRGYAFCAGQLLSIAQNTALFSLLGTTYGGDGQTTFALPDLRGRTPIGAGQGPGLPNYVLGGAVGNPATTLLNAQMPLHNHRVNASQASDTTNPAGAFPGNDARSNPINIFNSTADGSVMNPLALSITGGSQPLDIQNPILGLNYIIATEGLYPSRN
jgi:microcystin-dependent protein